MNINEMIDKIYEKKFKTQFKGYKKLDVDTFLDEIIEELEKLDAKVDRLMEENEQFSKENFKNKVLLLKIKENNGSKSKTMSYLEANEKLERQVRLLREENENYLDRIMKLEQQLNNK